MFKQLINLVFLGFFWLGGNACAEQQQPSPDSTPGTTRVNAEELIALANEIHDLLIIDARITSDRSQGYIESSINLPDIDTDCDTLSLHINDLSQPVLFYCNGVECGRSAKSAQIALDCGYQTIYWFRGGYEEWIAKGYPVVKD